MTRLLLPALSLAVLAVARTSAASAGAVRLDTSLVSGTFAHARQNDVGVLVGSNQDEGTLFQRRAASAAQFVSQIRERWGGLADAFLRLYPAGSDEQATPRRSRCSATR